jgi:hypothetical protein
MQGDPDQFAVDVRRWVDKAKGNVDAAYQATAMLALARVKQLTPVRTGFMRASWTIVSGDSAASVAGGDEGAIDTIANLKAGDAISLVNPAPYAMRINFGFVGQDSLGRHYDQKGRHMVEQTMAEMPALAQQAVNWVLGGGTPFTIGELLGN